MFRATAIAALALITAGLGVAPTRAEVAETTADRFVTRATASVKTPPLATWLALTRPADWWNGEHSWSGDAKNLTLTPQGGGCFCERIPVGDSGNSSAMEGSARHAEVLQAFPMRVLRMSGGFGPLQGEPVSGVLTITLKEVPGGTRILWEYNVGGPMRYKITDIAPAVDAMMSEQLKRLQAHLGPLDETQGRPAADAPAAETPPAG
ncbi:MAG: SRPBCC family protein [Altererythrobacter sp.]|nr:SRPBCC family protein [Altererythrobacter sp.]